MAKRKRHWNQPIETVVQPVGRINRNFDELKKILITRCVCLMLWEERLRQHGIPTQSTESSNGEVSNEAEVTENSEIIKIESDDDSDITLYYD